MNNFRWLLAVLLTACLASSTQAYENSLNITVKVIINAAPCNINNNQLIDVDFGDSVITTDVISGTVEKLVNYTLDCSNADASKALKMTISGAGADFDSSLLKTSIPELAVKLMANGVDLPLNTALNFASEVAKPSLVAVLVAKPGVRLPTGDFTAGATMKVDYQ